MSDELTSSAVTLMTPEPELATEDYAAAEATAQKAWERKAVHGTFWTVADYASATALRVAGTYVLTRLLLPESFGLMTLVTTMVVGISLLSDIGLGPSVIQSPRGDDPAFLNTVWTLQVLRGLAIAAVALLLAWPMSLFYHEPRLVPLVIALGGTVIISAWTSTNLLSLSRHMGVRQLFVFDFSSQIVTLVTTISWAYFVQKSVWALVAGSFASQIYRLSLSYYRPLVPGIRNKFALDKESVQSLVRFGKWILMGTAFYFFASQGDRLILGKLVTLTMLGVYGIAYSVSDIPRAVINAFSQKVGYPFIAKMAHLPVLEFRQVFLRYRFRVLLVGALLLSLMVFLGGEVVLLAFRAPYHGAAWMVPILALGLWHTLLYSTTIPALYSLGKSRYSAIGNVLYGITIVSAIPVGFHFFGMAGAVVAVAAGDLPQYFVTVSGASREGVSTWRQDLLATLVFIAFLGVGLFIRKSIFG